MSDSMSREEAMQAVDAAKSAARLAAQQHDKSTTDDIASEALLVTTKKFDRRKGDARSLAAASARRIARRRSSVYVCYLGSNWNWDDVLDQPPPDRESIAIKVQRAAKEAMKPGPIRSSFVQKLRNYPGMKRALNALSTYEEDGVKAWMFLSMKTLTEDRFWPETEGELRLPPFLIRHVDFIVSTLVEHGVVIRTPDGKLRGIMAPSPNDPDPKITTSRNTDSEASPVPTDSNIRDDDREEHKALLLSLFEDLAEEQPDYKEVADQAKETLLVQESSREDGSGEQQTAASQSDVFVSYASHDERTVPLPSWLDALYAAILSWRLRRLDRWQIELRDWFHLHSECDRICVTANYLGGLCSQMSLVKFVPEHPRGIRARSHSAAPLKRRVSVPFHQGDILGESRFVLVDGEANAFSSELEVKVRESFANLFSIENTRSDTNTAFKSDQDGWPWPLEVCEVPRWQALAWLRSPRRKQFDISMDRLARRRKPSGCKLLSVLKNSIVGPATRIRVKRYHALRGRTALYLSGRELSRQSLRSFVTTDKHEHFDLGGRIDSGDTNYPPTGSPKRELVDSAFMHNGGVVDPNTCHYYTELSGTMFRHEDFAGSESRPKPHRGSACDDRTGPDQALPEPQGL